MSRLLKDYAGMIAIGLLFLVGFGAAAIFIERETEPEPVAAIATTPFVTGEPDLLIDATWLAGTIDTIDVIIDLSDKDVYDAGHIPGAVHVWYEDTMPISSAGYGEGGSLSDPASGALTLEVPPDARIVVYDNNQSERAARFLWLLRTSGFENSWVLDGGLAGWKGTGNAASVEAADLPSIQEPIPVWVVENEITTDELFARVDDPALTIIDTRTPDQQQDTINETVRTGKIPGSWSIPATDVMRDDGTFRAPDELRDLFDPLGIEPGSEVVVYGRFGSETGQVWLALRLAGYDNVRVYDDGWVNWGWNVDLPIEPLGTQPQVSTPVATVIASPVASPAASPIASPGATPR